MIDAYLASIVAFLASICNCCRAILTTGPVACLQTPWVGNVKTYVLKSAEQFLPNAPPDLQSDEWTVAFQYLQAYGAVSSSVRTPGDCSVLDSERRSPIQPHAVQHFRMAEDMVEQVMNARQWGGLHYPFSVVAGEHLGREVAIYDLGHAFKATD